jgi:hypothetical protein
LACRNCSTKGGVHLLLEEDVDLLVLTALVMPTLAGISLKGDVDQFPWIPMMTGSDLVPCCTRIALWMS